MCIRDRWRKFADALNAFEETSGLERDRGNEEPITELNIGLYRDVVARFDVRRELIERDPQTAGEDEHRGYRCNAEYDRKARQQVPEWPLQDVLRREPEQHDVHHIGCGCCAIRGD